MYRLCPALLTVALLLGFSLPVVSARAEPDNAAATRDLAARSLTGPWAFLGAGAGIAGGAVVGGGLAVLVITLRGHKWLGCTDDGFTDEECVEEKRVHDREAARKGRIIAIAAAPVAAIGLGVMLYGVARVVKIRAARRTLRVMELTDVDVGPHGAQLALTLRF